MKVENIGNRGVLFTFETQESGVGEFCVYLIIGEKNLYLCDTHLGPESMEPIKEYIETNGLGDKPLVVFFSHADWDHIWGACAFPGATIIAHDKCPQRIFDRGRLDLERYGDRSRGNVKLVYPTLTFDSRISFRDDGVEFIHAPGHTTDSAICLDRKDQVMYAGDLVEKPEPCINHHDLEVYVETLESLKAMSVSTIISSHSGIVDAGDIEENIEYIRNFQDIALSEPAGDEYEDEESRENGIRKLYVMLMYEDAIQQTAGHDFDYLNFQREFWTALEMDYLNPISALLRNVSFDDLKTALETYMTDL